MNTEMPPQIRSLVSGLAAIAATTLLMTSLVESFDPQLWLSSGTRSTPASAATVDIRSSAALIRIV
jgi:hypothetical protein